MFNFNDFIKNKWHKYRLTGTRGQQWVAKGSNGQQWVVMGRSYKTKFTSEIESGLNEVISIH